MTFSQEIYVHFMRKSEKSTGHLRQHFFREYKSYQTEVRMRINFFQTVQFFTEKHIEFDQQDHFYRVKTTE